MLGVAAGLRILRVPVRWDEVSWLYSAYPAATVDALSEGRLEDALTGFTGLHPPLWPLLHALSEILLPVPLLWLGFSAACSFGAVLLVCRRSLLAGLVLATSPIQVAYSAEVNQYPLTSLLVALAWVLREEVAEGRRHWAWLAATGIAAGWTHLLAGFSAGLAALTLPHRKATGILALMALASIPLLLPVLDLLDQPRTFGQPSFKPALVLGAFQARFGFLGLLLAPALVLGMRRRPALAIGWLGTLAFIILMVALGIAAPHQFPYALALGPPGALLVAAGARSRALQVLVIGVSIAQAGWLASFDILRLQRIASDEDRAIDLALSELSTPWTCEGEPSPACTGDALYLLAPPGLDDDDKGRYSPVLWRLAPWWPMPRVRPYDFDHGDHHHGQPRLLRGHVVYVNDHLRPALLQAAAAHPRLWLVVYEQGRRREFTDEVDDLLGMEPILVGGDRLYRLRSTGPVDPASPGR